VQEVARLLLSLKKIVEKMNDAGIAYRRKRLQFRDYSAIFAD
jgi:hypothetical protein